MAVYPPAFSRDYRRAQAAGGLADHLAANPLSRQVANDPRRQAMQQRRTMSIAGLQDAQRAMAEPITSGPLGPVDPTQRNQAARLTLQPQMGNQDAIDLAYARRAASRSAKPTARIGSGPNGQPMHAQGVTMDQLFPSAADAGNRTKFEAAQEARSNRKAEARQMRQDQLAQQRQAAMAQQSQAPVINPFMNPIAMQAMRRDPTLALGAVNSLNDALQSRSRLDQIASQAQQQNELANKRFSLDDFVQREGVTNQGNLTTAQIADMAARQGVAKDSLGLRRDELALRYGELQNEISNRDRMTEEAIQAGQYQRSPEYLNHQLKLAGRETAGNDEPLTPAESFQASLAFSSQDPETQARSIDWGANAIRQDPSRAGEISQMVGASDEDLLRKYEEAFESPSTFVENDTDGEMQKARIERIGLMLDARGIPRPSFKRQLPWLQEFLGWSYANPSYTGRTLDDLLNQAQQ